MTLILWRRNELHSRKLTCHLKRDHFKRKLHLPTINFSGPTVKLQGFFLFLEKFTKTRSTGDTLPETNIAPKNDGVYFQGIYTLED